ncbi:hypothetical protein PC123_g26886 [Phytophthora cactorum]|nr:hypothetical protein PC120_g26522 [Phytophthora cactorum]KAG4037550.1 hypothetical protein PC123_g26886 [Phytophthora cactorum]
MPKPNLTDRERKAIIDELLKLSHNGELPRGAYARVGTLVGRDPTRNRGSKRKNRDDVREKLASVPVEDRAVERRISASGLSRHLISENKMRRVEHALSFIDDTTLYFKPMHNIVYVDEKRLYADRINRRSYLVFDGEGLPPRVWKSKRFVSKTTFLAALARPRYDPYRKQRWNGKVGVWSFTEKCLHAEAAGGEGWQPIQATTLGKAKLRRAKQLPVNLFSSRELYESAIALLKSANRGSALLFDSTISSP